MALKDWKRKKSMFANQIYYNNLPNGISIEQAHQKGIKFYALSILKNENSYNVDATDDFKFFKTKSQALRYAKAYMKKH